MRPISARLGVRWLAVVLAVLLPGPANASDGFLGDLIRQRDGAGLRAALQKGADPNQADSAGAVALHSAVEMDDVDATDLLLRAGASVNAVNRYGVSPLTMACLNGSAAIVERLLAAGADPNTKLPEGESALMTASRTGDLGVVRMLLARGAEVNVTEQWKGQTALMWAVAQRHADVAAQLLASGADVRAVSRGGLTPLLFAVRAGDIPSVSALLVAGASIADATPDGTSALVLAILNAHYELAGLLLEHGADPNVSDPRGSALHVLAWMRSPGWVGTASMLPPVGSGSLDSLELVQALLARGANVNARLTWKEREVFEVVSGRVRVPTNVTVAPTYISVDGATPFFLAAKHADVPLMRVLAEHGADPTLATRLNVTPLIAAAGLGFWEGESPGSDKEALEAVRLAVKLGNDVNAIADFGGSRVSDWRWSGSTALHGAAIRGADAVVQFLIEQGARPDVRNSSGWTPLDVAEGVFVANTFKEKHATARLLRQLTGGSTPQLAEPPAGERESKR